MRCRLTLSAVALLLLARAAAAQYTWTNNFATDQWNRSDNWTGGTTGTFPNSATATATFGNAGLIFNGTVTINPSVQVQSITFANTSGSYAIGSAAGQILSGLTGITVNSGVTTTQTINLASVGTGSLIAAAGTTPLTITNNATLGANPTLVIGPNTVIGSASSTAGVLVTGPGFTRISGGFASGNAVHGGLTVSGGRLELKGDNSNLFGGVTVQNAGTLGINDDAALGGGGQFLRLDANSATAGGLEFLNTGVTVAHPVLFISTSRVVTNGTDIDTISGLVAGAGQLVKGGSGGLILSNASNTYSGGTVVKGGALGITADAVLGAAGATLTLDVNSATAGGLQFLANGITLARPVSLASTARLTDTGTDTATISGLVSGAGQLVKDGSGTLVLSNGSNSYSGGTLVAAGTLRLGASGALGGTAAAVTIPGTTLDLNGFNQTVGSLALSSVTGSGRPTVTTGSGTLTLGGNITVDGGGGTTGANAGPGGLIAGKLDLGGAGRTIAVTGFSGDPFELVVNAPVSGAGGLTVSGFTTPAATTVVALNAANTYTGPTTVTGGSLAATAAGALPAGTAVNLTGSGARLALFAHGTQTGVTAGNYNQTVGSLAGVAGSAVYLADATLTVGGDNTSTTFAGSMYRWTYSSTAPLNGTLWKVGTGTLTLSGSGNSVHQVVVDSGAVALPAGGSISSDFTYVGANGPATFSQTGGTHTVGLDLYLGYYAGASGTYALSGASSQLSTSTTHVGYSGTGTFNQTGGTYSLIGALILGSNAGGSGTYALGGGALSTQFAFVGDQGTGLFTQTGGTHTVTKALSLANGSGDSRGTYELSGGALSTQDTEVGFTGTGTFTQTGGAHTTSFLYLGNNPGSTGTYTLRGGVLQTGAVYRAQDAATGRFAFDGGTVRAAADTAALFNNLNSLTVGVGGAAIDTAGHAVANGQGLAHDPALGAVPDGGLTKTGAGTLALTGTNTYTGGTTVAGGTLQVASDALLGDPAGPVTLLNGGQIAFTTSVTTGRTFNLNSSALAPAAGNSITYGGATVNGGFLRGPGAHVIGAGGATFSGTTAAAGTVITQNNPATFTNFTSGGTITSSAALTWDGGQQLGSGSLAVNATVGVKDFESDGVITVNPGGALFNVGGSSLVLGGGSRTYVGTAANHGGTVSLAAGTTVELNGGLLVNNGTISGGPVNINYGGLAKGSGTYAGGYAVHDGGKFSPGNSPGLLSSGPATWGGGGTYVWEVNDATGTAGVNWDLSQVTGALTIAAGTTPNGRFTVEVDSLTGANAPGLALDFDPAQSYQWPIATATGGITGFDPAAVAVDVSHFANPTNGGTFGLALSPDGQTLSLTFTPVPEPGTLALTGLAAVGWVTFWRRRGTRLRVAGPAAGPAPVVGSMR